MYFNRPVWIYKRPPNVPALRLLMLLSPSQLLLSIHHCDQKVHQELLVSPDVQVPQGPGFWVQPGDREDAFMARTLFPPLSFF